MKAKETLEEAAEKYAEENAKDYNISYHNLYAPLEYAFRNGANWQAENMYGEEDLEKAFKHGILFKEESVSTCEEAIDTEFSMLVEQIKKNN